MTVEGEIRKTQEGKKDNLLGFFSEEQVRMNEKFNKKVNSTFKNSNVVSTEGIPALRTARSYYDIANKEMGSNVVSTEGIPALRTARSHNDILNKEMGSKVVSTEGEPSKMQEESTVENKRRGWRRFLKFGSSTQKKGGQKEN